MQIETKVFGTVNIPEEKILHFPNGIIGFPDMKRYALLHDEKYGDNVEVQWLQSLDNPRFAMPVINPEIIIPDYHPRFSDNDTVVLGEFDGKDGIMLVTMSIVNGIESATVNLSGPILINPNTNLGSQIILSSDRYSVKHPIYTALKALQKREDT